MKTKEELKDEVAMYLELALSALCKDWPETARLHIASAEAARHAWDAALVKEHCETS